jgi:heme a synthase
MFPENTWALRFTLSAAILALLVILLGATTRLRDAGLGCPDWPGCYGRLIISAQPVSEPLLRNSINLKKAWMEMIHRYAAALLVLLSFSAICLILRKYQLPKQPKKTAVFILVLLLVQGLLGKWTVTLRLYPLVVMSHLLGGFALIGSLWVLVLSLTFFFKGFPTVHEKALRPWAVIALLLIILQIILGGWTSSNYAAFVCPDFPSCQGSWWPTMHFSEGFHIGFDTHKNFEGGLLSTEARTAIQMSHRIGAVITALYLTFFAWKLKKTHNIILWRMSILLFLLLAVQLVLGILNVIWLLPLTVAIAHNGIAAALLLTLLTVNFYLNKTASNKMRRIICPADPSFNFFEIKRQLTLPLD